MRKILVGLLGLVLFSPLAANAQTATPGASPETDANYLEYECHELAKYSDQLRDLYDETDIEELSEEDIPRLRPSELSDLADDFFYIADSMDDMSDSEVPWVAEDYHELLIDQLSLYGNMFLSMSNAGFLGALAYTEDINVTLVEMQAAWDLAESRCGSLWFDEFPVGIDGGLLPEEED
jgi:hypothetical protein